METKYNEFDESVSVGEYGEFGSEDGEITSLKFKEGYENGDGHEGGYTAGRRKQKQSDETPDEQLRLLYVYFKDMSVEPLFTAQEEVEISAKLKNAKPGAGSSNSLSSGSAWGTLRCACQRDVPMAGARPRRT